MKNKFSFILLVTSFIALFISLGAADFAEASEFPFSVNPVLPENQIAGQKGYYDVLMQPGQEQELSLELANGTAQDVTVNIALSNAKTNDNGVVEYSANEIPVHSSLKHPFEDLVEYEKQVTIPAGSQQVYTFKVKMPEEEIPGVIAGGIFLQAVENENQESSEEQGVAVKNKFAYALAVLLNQSEAKGIGELKLTQAEAAQRNVRNVIRGHFENPAPYYLNGLAIIGEVTREGEDEVLYSSTSENMQMAPNSSFWYSIPLDGQELEAENYVYRATAYAVKDTDGEYTFGEDNEGNPQNYQKKWEFEQPFEVTRGTASSFNEADVDVQENKPDMTWIYYLLGAIIFLLLIVVILLVRRNKKKDE
ncbi:DUF916 and DUF3324 domain-containing protein [Enterococcus sp. 669A]|uniref:DUF916 and DUF3324 domain-containing protein n=1 Tax=Candidatus Enterococcus moelleringii TaxID=2815325 RepID=A0ABS3LAR5_9ENTE|nr:DUF916 and DUF3324 domain-containing protein [Enterococcus sp. 669A]MBO1306728.1 DUF916 and DUF3324 domain-containing protein [Enterococcus sp. 669A]